jgi:hypothetical protein
VTPRSNPILLNIFFILFFLTNSLVFFLLFNLLLGVDRSTSTSGSLRGAKPQSLLHYPQGLRVVPSLGPPLGGRLVLLVHLPHDLKMSIKEYIRMHPWKMWVEKQIRVSTEKSGVSGKSPG